jgi:branched-chain amino acid transport system substrate-binding protein
MTSSKALAAATLLGALALGAPAHAQISDDVVRIGVSSDHNGVNSAATGLGTVAAVRMAVKDFGGSVLGKPVEVVMADDQGKPDVGLSNVRAWVDGGKVDTVVGGGASSIALGIQALLRERKKVFIITGAGTSDLTGKACSPTSIHLAYDTFGLAASTGKATMERGDDTWFFITADQAFGQALERDATRFVKEGGGKVLGGVKHPTGTPDFSSYLLQAQASGAKVVALANSGTDMINAVKQAHEFGLKAGGQKLAGLLLVVNDVQGMGLENAQGLVLSESFYWDMNEETRAWSKRYMAEFGGKVPNMIHANAYAGVMHYLKAIDAAGTDDGPTVAAKMKATPMNDFANKDVVIRPDGRVLHTLHLLQVKSPAESKYQYDFYKALGSTPGDKVFRPLAEGGCPFL